MFEKVDESLTPISHAIQDGILDLSPSFDVNLSAEAREIAGIPADAASFAFAYPARIDWDKLSPDGAAAQHPNCLLVLAVCCVHVACRLRAC